MARTVGWKAANPIAAAVVGQPSLSRCRSPQSVDRARSRSGLVHQVRDPRFLDNKEHGLASLPGGTGGGSKQGSLLLTVDAMSRRTCT